MKPPAAGTNERPSGPSLGDLYFDTDLETLLYWNGTEWVPVGTEAISLNDLSDVDTSGVEGGMVIAYDEISGTWKPVEAHSLVDVDALDERYLSRINDDTAAGEITFQGKTNHESGVRITGGSNDNPQNKNSHIFIGGADTDSTGNYVQVNKFTIEGRSSYNADVGDYLKKYNFQSSGPILRVERSINPTEITANPRVAEFSLAVNEGELGTATAYTRTHALKSYVQYKTGFDNTKGG